MPGRVKYKQVKRPAIPAAQRDIIPRMEDPAQTTSIFENNTADTHGSMLNKQTIIWLVVISIIVIATLIIVTCLLCRCKCRKRKLKRHSNGHRYHPSLEVTDGRNEFNAWNRNAPPRAETYDSAISLEPLTKVAVRPAGVAYLAEPVVVEEAPLTVTSPTYAGKKGSSYYSGLSQAWKRVSQIGRAY